MQVVFQKELLKRYEDKIVSFFYLIYNLKNIGVKFYSDEKIEDDVGILSLLLKKEGIEIKKIDEFKDEVFFIGLINDERFNSKRSFYFNKHDDVYDFNECLKFLRKNFRRGESERKTKETKISCEVVLDGSGKSEINTGVGFFDHMLEQVSRHGNMDLKLLCEGDLFVDEHHTVEDCGIVLGESILKALGDKKGIKRYGFGVPMDESFSYCSIDLSGRIYLKFKAKFKREKVGDFPTELVEEFFKGVSQGLKANIHIKCKGRNDHHKIEAIFKSFAKALNEACRLDERSQGILPSTKEAL
jgi:imidazoleglycerol-phosphate dehydratase/histidinol-phosphatase